MFHVRRLATIRHLSVLTALACGGVILVPPQASASSITFLFTGVLEHEVSSAPMTDYPANTPVSGSFTFESTTVPYSSQPMVALAARYRRRRQE